MKVPTPEEMREIDRSVIERLGIPGCVLMELAGKGSSEVISSEYGDVEGEHAVVVCGRGNNGGDGFVVARRLQSVGAFVEIVFLGNEGELRGDANLYYNVCKKLNIKFSDIKRIKEAKIVVDAIFGTGFRGRPEGIFKDAIEAINNSSAFVLSIDIPSGVNGETGEVEEIAVIADATATMGLPKRGLLLYPGREYAGKIWIVDIGIPQKIIEEADISLYMPEREDVRRLLPLRYPWGHKGTFGKVLIISGSKGYTGASSLCSLSALMAGCGLCYLVIPESLNPIVEEKLTEVITIPAPEKEGSLSYNAIDLIEEWIDRCDVIGLGPGLSTRGDTVKLVKEVLRNIEKPCVVDADGLNALKGNVEILRGKDNILLTPHPGEFSRLFGVDKETVNKNRVEITRRFAMEYRVNILLKGAPTIISSYEGETFINPTGNSGLASGGTGDVLTGLIAGFMAQGLSPLDASILSAYIHGSAADIYSSLYNEYSLTAGSLMEYIPEAIKRLEKGEDEE